MRPTGRDIAGALRGAGAGVAVADRGAESRGRDCDGVRPAAALAVVDQPENESALADYHLLPSVRGNLLNKLGRFAGSGKRPRARRLADPQCPRARSPPGACGCLCPRRSARPLKTLAMPNLFRLGGMVVVADRPGNFPAAIFVLPEMNEAAFVRRRVRLRMVETMHADFHRAVTLRVARLQGPSALVRRAHRRRRCCP